MKTKSYLEIEVPIRRNARWFAELKEQCRGLHVIWQKGGYHITMAFLEEATEEEQATARLLINKRVQGIRPMTMRFDTIGAFTAHSGDMHIIHITSSASNAAFEKLTSDIRADLAAAGLCMKLDFELHVTLGRVLLKDASLTEVKARLAAFTAPVFKVNLRSMKYRVFRAQTIDKWTV